MIEMDWLKRWNQYCPNRKALTDGETGAALTYSELFQQSRAGADWLKQTFGLRRGDRVVLLATNHLESLVLFFSLQRLGATIVPINYRLTKREVDHIIEDAEPQLIVFEQEFEPLVAHHNHKKVSLIGPGGFSSCLQNSISKPENLDFFSQPDDAAMILYTSGTTGSPKGAIISNQALFWNSINTTLRLNITSEDSAVIFLPLFHTGGWNVLTTPFLHRGAHIVLVKKFEPKQVLALSQKYQCTLLFGVPTTMDMMARDPLFGDVNLSKIRYAIVGGEPMPIELIKTWAKKGIPVRQGYGLTEFGPNVFSLNEEDAVRKIGSIGFPNFYIQTKVTDEHGHEVKPGEIGELWLKGPMCMTGYWKNPKSTAATIIDGWLATGDLVRIDDEGYTYVVGRKKDMFISGGENVYPAEVEQVIHMLPQIKEVAVIGVADEKWGEVGKAFVVTTQSITPEEIKQFCQKNLAKFKIPRYFEFLPALPKGDSGKILKKELQGR